MNLMTPKLLAWLKELIETNDLIKFYKSKEWRSIRSLAMKRDHHECQCCKALGKYSRMQMVHHIKEVKDYPELALSLNNLESLCNSCHNTKHPEKLIPFIKKKKKFINEERW